MILLLVLGAISVFACLNGDCYPGNEFCGEPFKNAPVFHLMDQHGCGENDPNGPIFDPVHGVIHHFYQIHLAAKPGRGPDYGHFVSKDFIHWAALPVAIWNGLDSSVWPPRVTPYDNEAIYTGSAVVVDGAGVDGKPGIIQIYPGLCNKNDWANCSTGTLLAQAIPADYATDQLLTNWTKPTYNPIMESTQRDPATPWQTPSGEWRLRTYDSMVYGAASTQDMVDGKWYTIGRNPALRTCECPSLYPLPAATPGFHDQYNTLQRAGALPTHVHKTSCGGDWWQLGTYIAGAPKVLGSFNATPGWEDVFEQRKIDEGNFYASKDNTYPTKNSEVQRRINWGWATVPPASTQTLPREITFNPIARSLQQYPIQEIESLRDAKVYSKSDISVGKEGLALKIPNGVVRQSEIVVRFKLPPTATTFGILIGDPAAAGTKVAQMMTDIDMPGGDYNVTHYPDPSTQPEVCQAACDADPKCLSWTYVIRGDPQGSGDCCLKDHVQCPKASKTCTSGAKTPQTIYGCAGAAQLACTIDYSPAPDASADYYDVPVACGDTKDTLRILTSEKTVELRVFSDWTFVEVFFQQGRTAMTKTTGLPANSDYVLQSSSDSLTVEAAVVYPMLPIWVEPDDVRNQPRVYN